MRAQACILIGSSLLVVAPAAADEPLAPSASSSSAPTTPPPAPSDGATPEAPFAPLTPHYPVPYYPVPPYHFERLGAGWDPEGSMVEDRESRRRLPRPPEPIDEKGEPAERPGRGQRVAGIVLTAVGGGGIFVTLVASGFVAFLSSWGGRGTDVLPIVLVGGGISLLPLTIGIGLWASAPKRGGLQSSVAPRLGLQLGPAAVGVQYQF